VQLGRRWEFLGRFRSRAAGFSAAAEYNGKSVDVAADGDGGGDKRTRGEGGEGGEQGRWARPRVPPRSWEYKYVRRLGARWRAEGYRGKNVTRAHLGMFSTRQGAKRAVAEFQRAREVRAGQGEEEGLGQDMRKI